MDIAGLSKEFPRNRVSWRVQGQPYERNGSWSALALAYIDARDVMERLDHVCGPAGWQSKFTETPSGRVLCEIGILIDGEWVWKMDGAGATAVEGEKGGISDALKRAAVQWGVGRYLYDLDAPWVPCEVNSRGGKTYWKKWLVDPWAKVRNAPSQSESGQSGPEPEAIEAASGALTKAGTLDALKAIWDGLPPDVKKHPSVSRSKEDAKSRMAKAQPSQPILADEIPH